MTFSRRSALVLALATAVWTNYGSNAFLVENDFSVVAKRLETKNG